MALCAAAITGGVTVLTHFLPPGGTGLDETAVTSAASGPASARAAVADALLTPAPVPVPPPRTAALEQLTGTWTGLAGTGSRRVPITLVVTSECTEGHACGTLTTDLPACVGYLTLVRVAAGPVFDFATLSYAPGSSSACEPHPDGDRFILGDDVLAYHTEHGEGASGRLHRVP